MRAVCSKYEMLDVYLQIRHATYFIQKTIMWRISSKAAMMSIIGHRVSESIGCDNLAILEDMYDYFGGVYNLSDVLAENKKFKSSCTIIAAPFGESIFHSTRKQDPEVMDDSNSYDERGGDALEVIRKELEEKIEEATKSFRSYYACKKLWNKIKRHHAFSKIRQDNTTTTKSCP